ncbi:hypothetical protein EMPS_04090 [Entomortierella parvispora]|uniref:Uncharacterized protein n=1 Tax=Entomortierella parvispora TaxID=205924 RepID=A0A9P3H812_9FUNG|nr:hypothetical protein EMPS_04090 [Entomortierella parvispora]
MKNTPLHSRLDHSQASLFVLSTKTTGAIAAAAVGLATAARPFGYRMSGRGLLLSMGALQCGWLGANLAISFLEAPVKFLAPTPAKRSQLDVGRHVFSAFNKVEVLLAAFDLLGWYLLVQRGLVPGSSMTTAGTTTPFSGFRQLGWRQWLRFTPGLIVYVFESFALLPALRGRSARVIEGRPVESARIHTLYVALEAVKIAALTISTVTIGRALW